MEHNHPINEINTRAGMLGLPVRLLCEEAGVNHSTYWRWQQPGANPRLRDLQDALAAIERVLAVKERAVLTILVARYPDEAKAVLAVSPEEPRPVADRPEGDGRVGVSVDPTRGDAADGSEEPEDNAL